VPVAERELSAPSPLALASYDAGYALAFNDHGALSVFTSSDRAPGMRLVTRYPFSAHSLALGALHGRLSIAASASLRGEQVFAAGVVAQGRRLNVASNPDDAAALAVSPRQDSDVIVVGKPDHRAYASDVVGRTTIRVFITVRWNPARYTFTQLEPLMGVAADADARDGLLAVFGGISLAGHPIHTAYVLSP
jgi:hypothetical protein